MAKEWNDLRTWLQEVRGEILPKYKDRFIGTEEGKKVWDELVDNGEYIHNLEGALGRYEQKVASLGFNHPKVTVAKDGTYKIVFFPSGDNKIPEKDCPSLTISATTNQGVEINNALPSIDLAVWARQANGEVGLVSALAAGIDTAIEELDRQSKWLTQYDLKKRAQSIKIKTRNSIKDITHYNPAISTSNQSQDFREATTLGNIGGLRREAVAAMSGQTLVAFYNRSLYEQHKGKIYGAGAPKTEKAFFRQLEDLRNGARAYSDIDSLSNYVRTQFPWIYKNIWTGDLENLYKKAYAMGTKQGTKKEGAPSIMSFFDVPTPGSVLAPYASNKPAKNLRLYQRHAKSAKNKAGSNYVFTKDQQKLYTKEEIQKGKHVYPLYNMGFLTDDDIKKAALKMAQEGKKVPLDALKGVGSDGSVFAAQVAEDFVYTVSRVSKVSGSNVQTALHKKAEAFVKKRDKGVIDNIDSEVNKILTSGDYEKQRKKWVNEILKEELGLQKNESVDKYEFDKDTNKYITTVKERRKGNTFTARGGATSDLRTVTSIMNSELLGRAFLEHGYRKEEVYIDGDPSKGLRMTLGVGEREFKGKNIWSDLNGVFQYIVSELRNKVKVTKTGAEQEQEIERNKAVVDILTKDPIFKKFISFDKETGNIIFDNEAYGKLVLGTDEKEGIKPSGMLKTYIDFAQKQGIYNKEIDYYKEYGDTFKLLHPLVMATEFGASSGVIYQGKSADDEPGMKFSFKELNSLKNTIGRMTLWDKEGQYKTEIKAFSDFVTNIEDKMNKLKEPKRDKDNNIIAPGWASYEKNADAVDLEKGRNAILDKYKNYGLIVTEDDLKGFATEIEYDGDIVYSEGEDLLLNHLAELRKQRYEDLVKKEGIIAAANLKLDKFKEEAPTLGAGFHTQEEIEEYKKKEKEYDKKLKEYDQKVQQLGKERLEKAGIYSEFDIQTVVDLGKDKRVLFERNGEEIATGAIALGLFNPEKAKAYDEEGNERKNAYRLDQVTQEANRQLKTIMNFFNETSVGFDQKDARRFGARFDEQQRDIRKAIVSGSIFEEMNKLALGEGSEYLLMQSMNTNAKEILEQAYKEKGLELGSVPNYIMSSKDAFDLLNKQSEEDLLKKYKEIYGQEYKPTPEKGKKKKTKGSTKKSLINNIIESFRLESKNFKGATDSSFMTWRSPTLKMFDDILGGSMIVSDELVKKGNIMVSPDLAKSYKGDFDGDRIAIFNALGQGNFAEAQDLIEKYFYKIQMAQEKARIQDSDGKRRKNQLKDWIANDIHGFGKYKDRDEKELLKNSSILKSLLDKNPEESGVSYHSKEEMDIITDAEEKGRQAAAANAGYKGAGIYGNLLYGISEGLRRKGSNYATILNSKSQGEGAFAGHIATALAGTLYQEGINIKNTKTRGGENINPQTILDDIMFRVGKGRTWNDYDSLLAFLNKLEDTQMIKGDAVFKADVAANHGLYDGEDGLISEQARQYYADMAKRAADYNKEKGRGDVAKRLLQESKNFQEGVANNLSKELVAFIISSTGRGGLNWFLNQHGTTIGDIVNSQYDFIEGNSSDAYKIKDYQKITRDYDEEDLKVLKQLGIKEQEKIDKVLADPNAGLDFWLRHPATASWNRRLKFYEIANNNNTVLGSPHQILNQALGVYTDKYGNPISEPNTNKLFKETMDEILSTEGKKSVDDILLRGEKEKFISSQAAFLKGEIVHLYQELMVEAILKGQDIDEKSFSEKIAKDPRYAKKIKEFDYFLEATGADEIDRIINQEDIAVRSAKHFEAVASLTNFDINEYIKKNTEERQNYAKQHFVGAEVGLSGQFGKTILSGIADLIMKSEDGRLLVGEHKTGEKLSARDFTQSWQYVDFLNSWREDILESGATNAEAYFMSIDPDKNPYVKKLNASINYLAKADAVRKYESLTPEEQKEKDKESFIAKETDENLKILREKIYNTFDALKNSSGVDLALTYTGGSGVSRQYIAKGNDDYIRALMAKAQYTQLNQNEQAMLLGRVDERMPLIFDQSSKYAEDLKGYIEIRKKLEEARKKRQVTARKIFAQQILGPLADENVLSELKIQQKEEDAEFNTILEEENKAKTDYKSKINKIKTEKKREKLINEFDKIDNDFESKTKDEVDTEVKEYISTIATDNVIKPQKTLEKEKTSLLIQKDELSNALKNPFLSNEEREAYETILKETEKKLEELNQQIESVTLIYQRLSSHILPEVKDEYVKLLDTLKKDREQEKEKAKTKRELEFTRKTRTEENRLFSKISSAVKGVSEEEFGIWSLDQKIEKEKDPKKKKYLEMERVLHLKNLQIEKDELNRLKEQYQGNEKFDELLGRAQEKANLAKQIKTNEALGRGENKSDGGLLGALGSQSSMYFRRFLGGGVVIKFLSMFEKGIRQIIQQTKELDKVMTDIRVVTNGTSIETRNLISDYTNLGKELGVTTKEIAQSGVAWMRQGYEAQEANKLIKASIYLSKLGMLDSAQATSSLTSALKGFKLEATDAMSVVDKLTAIDLKAATSAGDIAQGLAQFANLGSLAGVDIDQAAAYVSTIADVTQMSGASAGQALKTIISRYGNVKAGAYNKLNVDSESTDTGENLNDVEKVLNKIGISVRTTNLQFKDFDEVLAEIAEKWNNLDNVSKKAIANAFAGIRQQESFVTLLENWDKYQELLETSKSSEGTAETKYQSPKESLAAAANRLTVALEKIANDFAFNEMLKTLTNIATSLAEFFPKFLRMLPGVLSVIESVRIFTGKSKLTQFMTGQMTNFVTGYKDNRDVGGTVLGSLTKASMNSAVRALTDKDFIPHTTEEKLEVLEGKKEDIYNKIYAKKEEISDKYLPTKLMRKIKTKQADEVYNKAKKKINKTITSKKFQSLSAEEKKAIILGIQDDAEIKFDKIKPKTGKISKKDIKQEVKLNNKLDNKINKIDELENRITKQAEDRFKLEQQSHQEVLRKANTEKQIKQTVTEEKNLEDQVQKSRDEGKRSEDKVEEARKEGARAEKSAESSGSGGTVAATGLSSGASAVIRAISTGISLAITTALSALSTIALTGGSHTYTTPDGKKITMASSEEANAAGKLAKSYNWLPIVGPIVNSLDEIFGWTDNVMAEIDKKRDDRTYAATVADEQLSKISSMSGLLQTLEETKNPLTGEDVTKRQQALGDILGIYADPDNQKSRDIMESEISKILENVSDMNLEVHTVGDVLDKYETGTSEEQKKALKLLQLAQMRTERKLNDDISAEKAYQREEQLEESTRKYYATMNSANYTKDGIRKEAANKIEKDSISQGHDVGMATAGIIMGGAATAGMVAALAGAATASIAIPVVGLIAGPLLGLAAGFAAYTNYRKQKIEQQKREEAEEREWDRKTTQEQIEILERQAKSIKERIDAGNSLREETLKSLNKNLDATNEYLKALRSYQSYLNEELAKLNQNLMKEALVMAHKEGTTEYLTDMTIPQLKALGIQGIYESLNKALTETGALIGVNTYTGIGENQKFSQEFINIARKALGEDNEISAVLSGQSYSLREALSLDRNNQFTKEILQNFATALGVSYKDLTGGKKEEAKLNRDFGLMKLSDLLLSTSGTEEEIEKATGLIDNITDSSNSVNSWMQTIINQYPELIAYMSDTPELMDRIMEKLNAFSNIIFKNRWDELAQSQEFFLTEETDVNGKSLGIRNQILDQLDKTQREEAKNILDKAGVTNMQGLVQWINGLSTPTSLESEIIEAFKKAGSSYEITSDLYKSSLSRYIEYNTGLLDDQINNLQEQKEALSKINEQREYENKLIKARNELENAQNEKKRVYRAGVGWVYEADQEKIEEAQKGLKDLETEKKASELEVQIQALDHYKTELSSIWDQKNKELLEQESESFEKGLAKTLGLDKKDGLYGHLDLIKEATNGVSKTLSELTIATLSTNEEHKKKVLGELQSTWNDYQGAIGTDNENAALAAYQEKWKEASNLGYTKNWTEESHSGFDNISANNSGSGSKYTANAIQVGKGKFEEYKATKRNGWLLPEKDKNGKLLNSYQILNSAGHPSVPSADLWRALVKPVDNKNGAADDGLVDGKDLQFWTKSTASGGPRSFNDMINNETFFNPLKASYNLTDSPGQKGEQYLKFLQQRGNDDIIIRKGTGDSAKWYYYTSGSVYDVTNSTQTIAEDSDLRNKGVVWQKEFAKGTLSSDNGLSLINEFGPEALVTPEGTITSLPSHTGVVPADITKNLWTLGELAPNILRALQMDILPDQLGGASRGINNITDESLNVTTLNMNVNADASFDPQQFVQALRAQAALTRNLK